MFRLPALDDAVAVACLYAAVLTVNIYPLQQLVAGAPVVANVQFSDERRSAEASLTYIEDEVQIRSPFVDAYRLNNTSIKGIVRRDQIGPKPLVAFLARRRITRLDAVRIALADRPGSPRVLIRLVSRTLMLRCHRSRNRERGPSKDCGNSSIRRHAVIQVSRLCELGTTYSRAIASSRQGR